MKIHTSFICSQFYLKSYFCSRFWSITSTYIYVLYLYGSPCLWQFFRLLLFLRTLTVLKRAGQVLYKLSLNLGLCYIFLLIRLELCCCCCCFSFERRITEKKCHFHRIISRVHTIMTSLLMLILITWLEECFTGFFTVIYFPPYILHSLAESHNALAKLGGWGIMFYLFQGSIYVHYLEVFCKRDLSLLTHLDIQLFIYISTHSCMFILHCGLWSNTMLLWWIFPAVAIAENKNQASEETKQHWEK